MCIVLADFLEYFPKTFAALPVGAMSTERFPSTGNDFTKVATKVVFPVPAYPFSIYMLLLPIVLTNSAMSVIRVSCSDVGVKGKWILNFSCNLLLFIIRYLLQVLC
ncbi:MAG: Uncharacterised protein [Cryomorphaceae bacterium]|nr:MAG: Uncharacterised protein [Cryomorphaceae bacterium]